MLRRVFLAALLTIAALPAAAQQIDAPPSIGVGPHGAVTPAPPAPPPPASAVSFAAAAGQSWAAGNQSSARNVCLGSTLIPAGAGQIDTTVAFTSRNYMLPNWGAPNVGANTSFQSSQVTGLLSFYDCGPASQPFSKRDVGESLGTSISYLASKDASHARGNVLRGYFEGGVAGQPIAILSKPTGGEVCTATGTGPQCFFYVTGGSGIPNGTNGGQGVFPFNQAWVGPTSQLGTFKAQIAAGGQASALKFVSWHHGAANEHDTQASYFAALGTLFTDLSAAAAATTGQATAVEYLIEQVVSDPSGASANGPSLAELQYIDANAGNHVHSLGPQYYRHAINPTVVTVGGTISAGDNLVATLTSSGITGSPVAVTASVAAGDTTTTVAAKLVTAIMGTPALIAAGVYAQSSGAAVSVYQPGTLQPPFTVAITNGSAISATWLYPTSSDHETAVDKVWKAEQIGQCEDQILQGADCPSLEVTATGVVGNVITLTYGGLGSNLLTSPLVEDTTSLPAATNDGFQLGVGMLRASSATAAGTKILHFGSSMSAFVAAGQYVSDLDNPTAIPAGTTLASITTTTATMSVNAAAGGVITNDRVVFGTCDPATHAISGAVVKTSTVEVTLGASPTGCTLSYALWGPGQQQTSGPVDSAGNHQLTGYYGAYGNIRDSYGVAAGWSGFTLRNFAMAQQWAF